MFNFLKKKTLEYPEFWNAYEAKFQEELPSLVSQIPFVVFDTETTGFNYKNDRILSIGAVKVRSNELDVSQTFEHYLQQERFNPESVKIHGILKEEKTESLTEEEAIRKFLKYIGNAVLVAHHAVFDIKMINSALKRKGLPKLKNPVLDTGYLYRKTLLNSNLIDREKNYSLDEIAEAFIIDVKDRHTAIGDAFITAIAFLKILGKLDKKKERKLKELLKL